MAASPTTVRTVEMVSRKHLAFWASGNGAAFRYGVAGHPTLLAPHLGPSAIVVGGHDSGMVATWPGFSPHVVSDACSSWAAKYQTTNESADTVGSGTSAATPFAAGGAGALLLEARRLLRDARTGVRGGVVAQGRKGLVRSGPLADGVFTMDEWRRVLLATATRRPAKQFEDGPACGAGLYPASPVAWTSVPAEFPEYPLIGYGAVDRPSLALGAKVLAGTAALPDRAATDEWFTVDRQVRETTHTVFAGP
jgi:hypothetical protein